METGGCLVDGGKRGMDDKETEDVGLMQDHLGHEVGIPQGKRRPVPVFSLAHIGQYAKGNPHRVTSMETAA